MPILQGALFGKRWVVGSSVHGCWLGSYEFEKQKMITKHVLPGDVFYDIGANVGFYTLLAAQLVGNIGHVYAFEPVPRNVAYLRRHVALNHFQNISIYEMAIADHNGVTLFQEGSDPSMGRFAPQGNVKVRVSSLDILIEHEKLRPPNVIKIDVEGAEFEVLLGAYALLHNYTPSIFLATHDHNIHLQCVDLLIGLGYQIKSLTPESVARSDELFAYQKGQFQ